MGPLFGPLLDLAGKVFDRVLPNPEAKAAAQLEILKLAQAGEFKQMETDLALSLAQTDINKVEAASDDNFTRRWRPAMGWCCVAIFAANYIGAPLLAWLSPLLNIPPPPRLDIGEVLPVLLGMLGLSGMRTVEKRSGVAG
jgi:hypothetical protein